MYLGRVTPWKLRHAVGLRENFFIHDGYEIREHNEAFNDTGLRDEFQLPVYQFARELADALTIPRIFDVGCGSGYKLITNFYQFETIGIDLPDTIHWVRTQYPDRKWFTPIDDLKRHLEPKCNMVICSDVIEHVQDPNGLIDYIKQLRPAVVVISTPDRDSLNIGTYDGPPNNIHHIREWNMEEFHRLLQDHFRTIHDHFNVDGCQIAWCEV